MLLHIMPFPRNIRRNNLSSAQPNSRGFSLAGIRFLGRRDADFEADALERWRVDFAERRRHGFARALGNTAALVAWVLAWRRVVMERGGLEEGKVGNGNALLRPGCRSRRHWVCC
jgi:hypothetical protein